MLDSFITQSRSILDRHVAFSTFVPVFLFLLASIVIVAATGPDPQGAWRSLTGPNATTIGQLLILCSFVGLAVVGAMIVNHFQQSIVRLWSGYPPLWLGFMRSNWPRLRDAAQHRLFGTIRRRVTGRIDRVRSDIEQTSSAFRRYEIIQKSIEHHRLTGERPKAALTLPALSTLTEELVRADPRQVEPARVSEQITRLEEIIKNNFHFRDATVVAQITPWMATFGETLKQSLRALQKEKSILEYTWSPPETSPMAATLLGGVLDSAADQHRERYGIDLALFLPYFRQVAPATALDTLQSNLSSLYFFLNMATFTALLGILGLGVLLRDAQAVGIVLVVVLSLATWAAVFIAYWPVLWVFAILMLTSGLQAQVFGSGFAGLASLAWWILFALIAASFYRVAIRAAREAVVTVRSLIDVNRLKVFEALGFKAPKGFGQEKSMWTALSQYVQFGSALDSSTLEYASAKEAGTGERTNICTAKRRVRAGTSLQKDDLELVSVLASSLRPETARTIAEVAGRITLVDLEPKEQVAIGFLLTEDKAAALARLSICVPFGAAIACKHAIGTRITLTELSAAQAPVDDVLLLSVLHGKLASKDVLEVAAPRDKALVLLSPSHTWAPILSIKSA